MAKTAITCEKDHHFVIGDMASMKQECSGYVQNHTINTQWNKIARYWVCFLKINKFPKFVYELEVTPIKILRRFFFLA